MSQRPGVLVLCTGNSARSQMAEALLRRRLGGRMPVYSAGTEPGERVHPLAVRVMEEVGLPLDGHEPKHFKRFLGRLPVHTLITVCSGAEASCPAVWPGIHQRLSWPFDDPAACEGTDEECLEVFRRTRDAIEAKVAEWVAED